MRSVRSVCLPPVAAFVALAVAVATGCGSSDDAGYGPRGSAVEKQPTATATSPAAPPGASARSCDDTPAGTAELRVTGIGCDAGRGVVAAWAGEPACAHPAGASRFSCALPDGYRCLAATTDRGMAVSCSRSGSSVAFVAKRER